MRNLKYLLYFYRALSGMLLPESQKAWNEVEKFIDDLHETKSEF